MRPTPVALLAAALLTACGGTTNPPDDAASNDASDAAADSGNAGDTGPEPCVPSDGGAAVTFSTVYAQIMGAGTCGAAGECHIRGSSSSAGLDMSDEATARTNLVDVNAVTAAFCTPADVMKRVAPGDPDHSMLWRRVSGETCAERMPLGRTPLTCAQQNLIRDWIAGGAQ